MIGQASGADQISTIAITTNGTRYLTFTPSSNATAGNRLIAYCIVNQATLAATTASVWIYRVVSLDSNLVVPINLRAEIINYFRNTNFI
jgi:hypothetical protein